MNEVMSVTTKSSSIESMIAAHGLWKSKLKAAIAGKTNGLSPAAARNDTECDLGKLLLTADAGTFKTPACLQEVRKLHVQFHAEVANVLELVAQGRKKEAEQSMSPSGAFARTSTALVTVLMKCKQALN